MSNFDFFRTLTNDTDLNVDTLTCENLTVNNNLGIAGNLSVDGTLKVDLVSKNNNTVGIQILDPVGVLKTPNALYGLDVSGSVNLNGTSATYLVNGTPISGSKWTQNGTNIYRDSFVGINTEGGTQYYDLQVGRIDTSTAADRRISLNTLTGYNSELRLTENSAAGALNEYGFSVRYNGTGLNNRLEILSGSTSTIGADFANRSLTIARDSGNACFGSTVNTSYPLSVTSASTSSRQLNVVGATNASLSVNNTGGTIEVAVAGGTAAFSNDAVLGDAVIRQTTASRKLILQCGTGGSAICIDNANNVGISKATGLGSYKLDVLGGIGSQNSSITCYTNTTTSSAGFRVLISGQTTRTGLFGTGTANDTGFQLLANDALAITASSLGNVGIGTLPHSSYRLNVDGSARVAGSMDVVGGNQYMVSGVQLNTSHIPESTNLYYTSARATTDARLAISATATAPLNLTYDNTTGILSGSITGSAISKWTDAPSGGVYRNSQVAINGTDTLSGAALSLYCGGGVLNGIHIESTIAGAGAEIMRYKNFVEGVDYKVDFDATNGLIHSVFNYNTDSLLEFGVSAYNNFILKNPNDSTGVNLKFNTNLTAGPTRGATISYGGITRPLYIVNEEAVSLDGAIQFWTNNGVNTSERWRIDGSGNLTNKLANGSDSLDVEGTARIGSTTSGSLFTTGSVLEIGKGRTTNGNAYIDLVGDTTYTDYGFRLLRNNTGANANSDIVHKGTGQLRLQCPEAGSIAMLTSNTERMRITSTGNVGIGTTNPGHALDVNGNINFTTIKNSPFNVINVVSVTSTPGSNSLVANSSTFSKVSGATRLMVWCDGSAYYQNATGLMTMTLYLYTSANVYTGLSVQYKCFHNNQNFHMSYSFCRTGFGTAAAGTYYFKVTVVGTVDPNDSCFLHVMEIP